MSLVALQLIDVLLDHLQLLLQRKHRELELLFADLFVNRFIGVAVDEAEIEVACLQLEFHHLLFQFI